MPNFDRSAVKHGTQNIQNDCHHQLSDSFKVHQIRFRPGLSPGPQWGSLQRSADPLAGLRGKGRGGKRNRERRRKEEGDGKDPPPFANSLIRPWSLQGKPLMLCARMNRTTFVIIYRSHTIAGDEAVLD